MDIMKQDEIANYLLRKGYGQLFLQTSDDINLLWNNLSVRNNLYEIILNETYMTIQRFLASEIFFIKENTFPFPDTYSILSTIYATQLADSVSLQANIWCMPGYYCGESGKNIIRIGNTIIPNLISLLSQKDYVYYEGSEEATLGNEFKYRINDLAAYFICQICHLDYKIKINEYERDEEINKIKIIMRINS